MLSKRTIDLEEADNTGVFSPPVSKQNSTFNQDIRDKETSVSETDGTDVFSPDTSFRSRFVRSLHSSASKENTPPHTETPSITKQLEGIETKGAKRKQHFSDVLNSQHLNDDSYNKVEDIFDDLEVQETNLKRIKRFHLNTEESASNSNNEDIGVLSSQDETKTKRRSRFELMNSLSFQNSEDSLFSDVFECLRGGPRKKPENRHSEELNNERKIKRKPHFEPPVNSQESLQYSAIFNSVSVDKNKVKRGHGFVMSSSQNNDESRYSDIFESGFQNTEKPKQNNRFVISNLQQSEEESLCYSDLSIMRNRTKVREKHHFVEPASQDEKSISYSDISAPQNESNIKKSNHFVDPASQETENSLEYSNMSLLNDTNIKKSPPFINTASQETENILGYSNILPSQNESNVEKRLPFINPAFEEVGNSLGYSNILSSQNESNVEKNPPFINTASQETENSLGYSNILLSQNESNVEKRQHFVNPASQDIEDSYYSEITISIDESEQLSGCPNNENSVTLEKCEKTSCTDFTSIRSISIDTVGGSSNIPTPSISKTIDQPINLTYDVSNSAFCQREAFQSVNINLPSINESKNDISDFKNIGSPKVPVVSTINASYECVRVSSGPEHDANQHVLLIESKIESSKGQKSCSAFNESSKIDSFRDQKSSSAFNESSKIESFRDQKSTSAFNGSSKIERCRDQKSSSSFNEFGNKSADDEKSSLMADKSKNQSFAMQESGSNNVEYEKGNIDGQKLDSKVDRSENRSSTQQKSGSDNEEYEKEDTIVQKTIPMTDESKNESAIVQESVLVTAETKDTNPNSSNVPSLDEKIVEESVYVDHNPSSVNLPVTVLISSSRSRSSTSFETFASRSSLSVFSKSKIGRRSTASSEFKVPKVPKVVSEKKKTKNSNESFAHLPSKPNFPKFDFYCNKRFYDYLTGKLESKYGIRTNNEAVKLAHYISDVVKEVITMKTGDHHILVEEMKVVLFRKGIVTTHYNFYMFSFDYLPPWFRRKAIPMLVPKGCSPRVNFDLSLLFNSIE